MDAKEYDKIVDKLMQFRGKIPITGNLNNDQAKVAARNVRNSIDNLLDYIDSLAELDALGWIK
tara:strand:+ start:1052 stop:1240 length:189 start_codon:yes stop_codon:yes gene_type:complete